ncbi:MAG: hypothetical protein WBZ36_00680 [Candidatus Nitrosopolaris sp.]
MEKTINKTYVIPDKLDIRIKKQAAEERSTQSNMGHGGVSKKK